MNRPLLLLLGLIVCGCTSVRTTFDYDDRADFTAYSTYGFYSELHTGLNDLDGKRLITALDEALQARGFGFSEDPDFLINIKGDEYVSNDRPSVGIGLGGGGGSMGGGISVGVPVGAGEVHRRIRFDFVDARKDQLFWQGIAEADFSENATPGEKETKFKEIVAKVLEKYPPKR